MNEGRNTKNESTTVGRRLKEDMPSSPVVVDPQKTITKLLYGKETIVIYKKNPMLE